MKGILLGLISLTLSFQVYSANVAKRNIHQDSLQTIIKEYEYSNRILEERLQQASDTIANQNALFTSFGVIYTIIAILIGLLTVGLPLVTYFFGIKPSQDSLKELQSGLDDKLSDFIAKTRNEQVEKAIEDVESASSSRKAKGLAYLTFTQYENLTDYQTFRLIRILKAGELDSTTEGTLAQVISNSTSPIVTEFFYNCIKENPTSDLIYHTIRHISLSGGVAQHRQFFQELLLNATNAQTIMERLIHNIANFNKNELLLFLNNKTIIDIYKEKKGLTIASVANIHILAGLYKLTVEELKDTYYYEKVLQGTI